ncbi:hypothetical protein [Glycomyces tritici]|jgi:hypothetical protein|uniref:Uncharacterized protein n=1 Tax=Glycomyces tritici TaxID=2665176 RepID=A0ABT7YW19_9ACTN|nr:hypothetical protein [Glycomyces tritici]MDN3242433.1 hypothetical protein [Glycomyces tritici]
MPAASQPDRRLRPISRQLAESRPAVGTAPSLQTRSHAYLDLLSGLDTTTSVSRVDTSAVRERVAAELAGAPVPVGIVARCHLGGSYVVHTLTWDLEAIVDHYKRHEPLPPELERARSLAAAGSYLAVEVYPEHLVCIRQDGHAIKVER